MEDSQSSRSAQMEPPEHLQSTPPESSAEAIETNERGSAITPPTLTSWDQIRPLFHRFEHEDCDGNIVEKRAELWYHEEEGNIYHGHVPEPVRDVSLEQASACLRRIPSEHVYPLAPAGISVYVADTKNRFEAVHMKLPDVTPYYDEITSHTEVADRFLMQAKALECVREHPHRHVVEFKGCVVRKNRIVALAIRRYRAHLESLMKRRDRYDRATKLALLTKVRSAVEHLHVLGLAHNNVTPYAVMIDDQNEPVLTAFDYCSTVGDDLMPRRWEDGREDFDHVSSLKNDEMGLERLEKWLGL